MYKIPKKKNKKPNQKSLKKNETKSHKFLRLWIHFLSGQRTTKNLSNLYICLFLYIVYLKIVECKTKNQLRSMFHTCHTFADNHNITNGARIQYIFEIKNSLKVNIYFFLVFSTHHKKFVFIDALITVRVEHIECNLEAAFRFFEKNIID